MRLLPTLAVTMTLALAVATVRAETPAGKKYDPREAFAQADHNKDGVIDHEEFHERMVEVFYSADVNRDGSLGTVELQALVFPEDFATDDRDQNGRVSLHEFLRVRFIDFTKADTDQDGVLSVDEVVAAYEGKKRR